MSTRSQISPTASSFNFIDSTMQRRTGSARAWKKTTCEFMYIHYHEYKHRQSADSSSTFTTHNGSFRRAMAANSADTQQGQSWESVHVCPNCGHIRARHHHP